jgi:hypothetical protein
MTRITSALSSQGPLDITAAAHNDISGSSGAIRVQFEISAVRADPAHCSIRYHFRRIQLGGVRDDADNTIDLRAVAKLEVMPIEELLRRFTAGSGWRFKAKPPMSLLMVDQADGPHARLVFRDMETAKRTARDFVEAIDLCAQAGEMHRLD